MARISNRPPEHYVPKRRTSTLRPARDFQSMTSVEAPVETPRVVPTAPVVPVTRISPSMDDDQLLDFTGTFSVRPDDLHPEEPWDFDDDDVDVVVPTREPETVEDAPSYEERRVATAAAVDLPVEDVAEIRIDLSAMARMEGIFGDVDTMNFHITERKLPSLEALGIAVPVGKDGKPLRNLAMGGWGMIPDTYRKAIIREGGHAHVAANRYALPLSTIRAILRNSEWKWYPKSVLPDLMQELDGCRARLASTIADLIAHYDDAKADTMAFYQDIAKSLDPKARGTLMAWVEANIPTVDEINTIEIRFTPGAIHLGSEIFREAQEALTEQLKAQQLHQTLDAAFLDNRRREAEVREQTEADRLFAELTAEARKNLLGQLRDPETETRQYIRSVVHAFAVQTLVTIDRRGTLHGSSQRSHEALQKWVKAMNFQGDQMLETTMAQLQASLTAPKTKGKVALAPIVATLERLRDMTKADADAYTA